MLCVFNINEILTFKKMIHFYNEHISHRSHKNILWNPESICVKCYGVCTCQQAPEEASPKLTLKIASVALKTKNQGYLLMMIQFAMEIQLLFILQK